MYLTLTEIVLREQYLLFLNMFEKEMVSVLKKNYSNVIMNYVLNKLLGLNDAWTMFVFGKL